MSRPWEPFVVRRPGESPRQLARLLQSAEKGSQKAAEPRRVVSIQDFPKVPENEATGAGMSPSRRAPRRAYYRWYDWALVWRYWHGFGEGLRQPYLLEILELLRLGEDHSADALAKRLGVSQRQVQRWRSRFRA